jgi:hypothetical protein
MPEVRSHRELTIVIIDQVSVRLTNVIIVMPIHTPLRINLRLMIANLVPLILVRASRCLSDHGVRASLIVRRLLFLI